MDALSSDVALAHAGHMKIENPRGDSWNPPRRCLPKTPRKSQILADSWRVGDNRGWRAASLRRRRSPVRTRCSAPTSKARPSGFNLGGQAALSGTPRRLSYWSRVAWPVTAVAQCASSVDVSILHVKVLAAAKCCTMRMRSGVLPPVLVADKVQVSPATEPVNWRAAQGC